MFGIFGINHYKGTYYKCEKLNVSELYYDLIKSKQDCMNFGGDWIIMDSNFDNVF